MGKVHCVRCRKWMPLMDPDETGVACTDCEAAVRLEALLAVAAAAREVEDGAYLLFDAEGHPCGEYAVDELALDTLRARLEALEG